MKLDQNKNFGVVYGHPSASFEQNGKVYDAAGDLIVESAEPDPESGESSGETGSAPLAFINEFFSDSNQIVQTAVYKAVEESGLKWKDVKDAFTEAGGKVVKIKNELIWQLRDA